MHRSKTPANQKAAHDIPKQTMMISRILTEFYEKPELYQITHSFGHFITGTKNCCRT